jgi:hypothetical protein
MVPLPARRVALHGKVMFCGGNLRATFDFAKKAAKVAHDNFVTKSSS